MVVIVTESALHPSESCSMQNIQVIWCCGSFALILTPSVASNLFCNARPFSFSHFLLLVVSIYLWFLDPCSDCGGQMCACITLFELSVTYDP